MSLTAQQLFAISVTERVCSAISVAGTAVIVTTLLASNPFRKPINRLVFYASWGNLMTNVATLVSQSGLSMSISGFMIQWFMPADALWAFAMACNVYLAYFHKYDAQQLRRIEWKYVLCCYGLPFIAAFSYFFIETKARGKVFGSAVFWCWISPSWDFLRIAVFYAPVWCVIFLTVGIYTCAGKVIYQERRQLREVEGSLGSSIEIGNPFEPSSFSKITEFKVTTESLVASNRFTNIARDSGSFRFHRSFKAPYSPHSVTVEAGGGVEKLSCSPLKRIMINELEMSAQCSTMMMSEASSAAWAYTKYAVLFFVALLVTWVQSTVNRVYAWAHVPTFGWNYASSFVLPLQGFWNSLIYVSISWRVFKPAFLETRERCRLPFRNETKQKVMLNFPMSRTGSTKRPNPRIVRSDSTQELTP